MLFIRWGNDVFADTLTEIVAYYSKKTGSLTGKRLLASFKDEPGLPDGSCGLRRRSLER